MSAIDKFERLDLIVKIFNALVDSRAPRSNKYKDIVEYLIDEIAESSLDPEETEKKLKNCLHLIGEKEQ